VQTVFAWRQHAYFNIRKRNVILLDLVDSWNAFDLVYQELLLRMKVFQFFFHTMNKVHERK